MARDSRKERQWRDWIGAWQDSGLTVRDFCRRHRLPEWNFYAWRRELQHRDTERPAFAPVEVVDEEVTVGCGVLEVVLTCGRIVRVPPGFDPPTLAQVVAVLEDRPC